MTHSEMIKIIQAHNIGKVIEVRTNNGWEVTSGMPWNWFWDAEYRVKPEPREVRIFQRPDGSLEVMPPKWGNPDGVWRELIFREVLRQRP